MRMIHQEMTELSKKIVNIDQTIPEGRYGIFSKTKVLSELFETYKSAQFLKLIPNIILVLNQSVVFS